MEHLNDSTNQLAYGRTILFEVGWEVCWQLGGIYTVLRSKVPAMQNRWGSDYYLIGPYNPDTAAIEFEEMAPDPLFAKPIETLKARGVYCRFGQWLVSGRPRVVLIEYQRGFDKLFEMKYLAWRDHGVQVPEHDSEVNGVIVFAYQVADFFQALCESVSPDVNMIAHCHEWMAGLPAALMRHRKLPVATVFTTHATIVGRYASMRDPHFYSHLDSINVDQVSGDFGIYHRYCIERSAAHSAHVFTTVSDITALECDRLLARTPDIITPNGMQIMRFAALHEFQNLHREYRDRIHEFVVAHFFGNYSFDLDRCLYVFTAGRYEYRNKGMDLFIESLARLNHKLKGTTNPPTVVAFIITRAPTRSINVEVLNSKMMYEELRAACSVIEREMGRRLFQTVVTGGVPQPEKLLSEDNIVRLKRLTHAWRRGKMPPIVTHHMVDDGGDAVLCQVRACQLFNAKEDPVKVVYHPDFVISTNPLFGLDYDQFVRGCHLGVFPSYYEPWGYTPMECTVSGVPSVSSDLSGFGNFVQSNIPDHKDKGLFVINRQHADFDASANELTDVLFDVCRLTRRERIDMRNRVESLSETFAWSNLARYYYEAEVLAAQRAFANT